MIEVVAEGKAVLLHGATSTYAAGIGADRRWVSLFWGGRIGNEDIILPGSAEHGALIGEDDEEFSGWDGVRYGEPAVKATFPDGVRDVWLRHREHRVEGDTLEVTLADEAYGLIARLRYRLYEQWDLIERTATLVNHGQEPVTIEQALSGVAHVPWLPAYRLTHLAGRWGEETRRQRQEVPLGSIVVESRRGFTGHHHLPWVAIDDGNATEEHGDVWVATLAWSGSWQGRIEREAPGQLRCTLGVQPFDFGYRLDAGESLTLPALVLGYSRGGFGQASRNLHAYQIAEVLPARWARTVRPVLFNSWYATEFAVTEAHQRDLATRAAALGVELFVIDDGWFGHRDSDRAGLGDWWPSPTKFPYGLGPLIEHVQSLGMEFGLWVEPEMVNPDSDLYRAHPDWVYHFPGRPRPEMRNQLVLNLGRPEVEAFIVGMLDRLLAEYPIRFIKWDMNRSWSAPGWPDAPEGRAREVWVRHIEALYRILAAIRQRHPDLLIESCAGGGGRPDLGILRFADQVWTSDNVSAHDRLAIQEGFCYALAPKVQVAWVTDNEGGRLAPLRYRFNVAMQGTLGIGGNLLAWSESELAEARAWIALYKEIRPIVQHGRLYRLLSPSEGQDAAVWYVAPDGQEGVAFATRTSAPPWAAPARLLLPGLAEGTYTVQYPDGRAATRSARGLAVEGLLVPLSGDFASAIIRVRRAADEVPGAGPAAPR